MLTEMIEIILLRVAGFIIWRAVWLQEHGWYLESRVLRDLGAYIAELSGNPL